MPQPPDDPWLSALQLVVLAGSVTIWIWIIAAWVRRETILDYRPRRPVPWGLIAALPAVALVFMALLSGVAGDGLPPQELAPHASQAMKNILAMIVLQGLLAGLAIAIAAYYEASPDDLGISFPGADIIRDFKIGVGTCLAAALPVLGLQGLLLFVLGRDDPTHHPLVKMMTAGEPSFGVLLLASVSAGLIAPVCEELVFRLLLQGWLEKWEHQRRGGPAAAEMSVADVYAGTESCELHNDGAHAANDEVRRNYLPDGWLPILTSSLLFGVAHFGYGPEPLPLLLFGVFLGYVYQRTHRILPCIAAHAAFNLISIVMLWRMVFHGAE